MNKERLIGLAVILVIVGGWLLLRGQKPEKLTEKELNGEGVQIEERASEFAKRMGLTLPTDVQKADLKDVTGGTATGLATRKYVGGVFTHTVLAAITDPKVGEWYKAWLINPDSSDMVATGNLRMAKGGWVMDFTSSKDLSDYKKVVVSVEQANTQKPTTIILEGNF